MKHIAGHNQFLKYMSAEQATSVSGLVRENAVVTATRLSRESPGHGYMAQHVNEDAFMMSVRLRPYEADLWVDGKKVDFPRCETGGLTLYNYNRTYSSDIKSSFDNVSFHIPRAALDDLADDLGGKKIDTLHLKDGFSTYDPVVRGLTQAMLPAFEQPDAASCLFMDQMMLALSIHLACTYGEVSPAAIAVTGGLASWQVNTALEIMDAHLAIGLPLAQISRACNLSPGYFLKAFRSSVGMTPHRWLMKRRIERAADLLAGSKLSIAEISIACGFPDQSYFSRCFSKACGASPLDWRRERSHSMTQA